jgi:lysozyme
MMKLNSRAIELIQHFESRRLKAYHGEADAPGVFTIGWGHVITGNEVPDIFKPGNLMRDVVITESQAEELFANDIDRFIKGVYMRLNEKRNQLTEDQLGAIVSLAFNIGLGNFAISAVKKTINMAEIKDAVHGFKSWIRSAGEIRNGLIRRRAAEAALFNSDYSTMTFLLNNSNPATIKRAIEYLDLDI